MLWVDLELFEMVQLVNTMTNEEVRELVSENEEDQTGR